MIERTTVWLPADLLDQVRRQAAKERQTLSSPIEDGLRLIVSGNHKALKEKRVVPRISKAGGGLRPDIDLDDRRAIDEL